MRCLIYLLKQFSATERQVQMWISPWVQQQSVLQMVTSTFVAVNLHSTIVEGLGG